VLFIVANKKLKNMDPISKSKLEEVLRSRGIFDRARIILSSSTASEDVFLKLREAGLTEELASAAREAGVDLDAATFSLLRRAPPVVLPSNSSSSSSTSNTDSSSSNAKDETLHIGINHHHPNTNTNPERLSLRVALGKGRAFLAHLDVINNEKEETNVLQSSSCFYVIDILCNNQRARSAPIRADVEPDFNDVFLFDVDTDDDDEEEDEDEKEVNSNTEDNNHTTLKHSTRKFPSSSVSLKRLMENTDADAALLHVVLTLVTQTPSQTMSHPSSSSSNSSTSDMPITSTQPETISEVIGTRTIDFRSSAYSESKPTTVLLQLTPVSPGPQSTGTSGQPVPVGLLPLSLQFLPEIGMDASPADGKLAAEKSAATASAAEKAFFGYSKAWWSDFKTSYPALKKRTVTIFAETESGNFSATPTFIIPLVADRVINSPAEAARFVSLIPYRETDEGNIGPKRSIWHSLHSIIAKRAGSAEDHAVLLASLLLGLGMDAYVVMGTRSSVDGGEEDAIWVITRYSITVNVVNSDVINTTSRPPLGSDDDETAYKSQVSSSSSSSSSATTTSKSIFRVNCWDPLTGHRSPPGEILPSGYVYTSVSSVFSNEKFYACCSLENSPASVSWDMDDNSVWKGMDTQFLRSLPHALPIPLSPPTLDCAALSIAIQASLCSLIEQHRIEPSVRKRIAHIQSSLYGTKGEGGSIDMIDPASTLWDERLSFTLQQALAAYEAERLYGVSLGSAEFAASVKRTVPKSSAFRGFPVLFNHLSPARMLDALLAANVSRDIIETPIDRRGAFALRVFVTAYCENVVACWVLVSVRTSAIL